MGVEAVLMDAEGSQIRRLPDPSGGLFDAAGDFDRLLDQVPDGPLRVWERIDPYSIVTMESSEMPSLLADLDQLTTLVKSGLERRGLNRLRVMAEMCRARDAFTIHFVGD